MSKSLKSILQDASRDASGATAVEFGLIAAPFMLTICAIFAIGLNFFMVAALDHAALAAARKVGTGAVSPSAMTASTFKQTYVCPNLPTIFNCNNVFVNLTVLPTSGLLPSLFPVPSLYYSYVNANQSGLIQPPLNANKDSFCPGAGSQYGAPQYVVLEVLYPAPYFASFLIPASTTTFNGQAVAVLMSSTTFMSEPYSGAAPYQGC